MPDDHTTYPSTTAGTVLPSIVSEPPGPGYQARQLAPTPPHLADIRAEMEKLVERDLLGPHDGPREELYERKVSERYLVGVLAPKQRVSEPETDEADELAEAGAGTVEEGAAETVAPGAAKMLPSAFGMTFCVDGAVDYIRIIARWGRYSKETLVHNKEETEPKQTGSSGRPWRRTPIEASTVARLKVGKLEPWSPDPEHPEVVVNGLVRKRPGDVDWSVSLFLVNGQMEAGRKDGGSDSAWLFQAELETVSADGRKPDIFVRRGIHRSGSKLDEDVRNELHALEMIYRDTAEFVVGHGIGVHADPSPRDSGRATRLITKAIPRFEVPRAGVPTEEDFPELAGLVLDMKTLSELDAPALRASLAPLVEAYAAWIERQSKRIDEPSTGLDSHRDAATRALELCTIARKRIEEGIALLEDDGHPEAVDAFHFMNSAMWRQRIHSIYSEQRRQGGTKTLDEVDDPKNRSWRPFQLAFILINLPSLTNLKHPERSESANATADLLWFPTGGGKTEAYLGLTAYTLAIRRLQGEVAGRRGDAGVAVLMRYTLRLLTLQQFQRATALICACESIRREAEDAGDSRWGSIPFRIGLWVGNKTTPNTTAQSNEGNLLRREQGKRSGSGDPAQLTNCPWCGSKIESINNITVDLVRGRTLLYCGDKTGSCLFAERQSKGEGLPVVVVDEEIYRLLPSLLIATVDKFAQMPWNGNTQALFGNVNGYCTRHGFRTTDLEDADSHPAKGGLPAARTLPQGPLRPPDLIIQDELHLISGPLGTLVGLYETAVDYLSTWEVDGVRVRPKVVASTATIRNARQQILKTFARQVSIFPPQGLDAGDNFFSLQKPPTPENFGRVYLGICAPGRRMKAVLIRVYLAYLAAGEHLFQKYGPEVADPWMTLVGYFNSMRELGGTRRIVDDEVRSGLMRMEKRGLPKRFLGEIEELTSRRNAGDIPVILDRLEKTFRLVYPKGERPIDVLLATNMVSVGVDIRRLGLMVVANQPKTTAEYIQATSRVGRTFPGLVCTVLNGARPRDMSHYERFEHYHATFYQYVEALSVTPFAERALDRGLAALLVSTIRLSAAEFNGNLDAAKISPAHPIARNAVDAIVNRAAEVGPFVAKQRVAEDLTRQLDEWQKRALHQTGGARLGYMDKRDGITKGLLHSAGQGPWDMFTALNSLRDVEPMVNLVLDDRGFEEEPAWLSSAASSAPETDAEEVSA
jgi:hypothetical protein